jgi:O-antigen/teichoic acid export membrane protein
MGAYPLSYFGMGISADLQDEVFISLMVAASGIPVATLSNGLRGALEGYERFKESNLARILLGSSIFLFPLIAVLLHGNSLITVTLWLVGARFLSCLMFIWLVVKLPSGKFWKAPILGNTRKKLFSFGAWMAITNIVSPLLVNADRFLISYLLGAEVVAYYTVPSEVLMRLLVIPAALGSSLFPNIARINHIDPIRVKQQFITYIKIVTALMFTICLIADALAYPLMRIFISEEFASKAWELTTIISIGIFVNGLAYLPYTALHASGNAKPTGILHIFEFIIYIPILITLINQLGLPGAAISWTLRVAADAVALFFLYAKYRK